MVLIDLGAGGHHPASARFYSHRIPWFAHTKSIQIAARKVRLHLRRRKNHNSDLPLADIISMEPAPEQVMMRGEAIHDAESQHSFVAQAANLATQSCAVTYLALPQSFGERDGVPV